VISLSAFVRYPDIVKAQLRISSSDMPKQVVPKMTGKLMRLLVANELYVKEGQPLGYLESTADHAAVLGLIERLKSMQTALGQGHSLASTLFINSKEQNFGELQTGFQAFFQAYINYRSAVENGLLLRKRRFLEKDIDAIYKQTAQLRSQRSLQEQDVSLAEEDLSMHKKLMAAKAETSSEFRLEESKYLARKAPMLQSEASLITANSDILAKQKEIMELDSQVADERSKFSQALNSFISQVEDWRNRYVLTAPQAGKVIFAGTIQQNQVLIAGQDVFYITKGSGDLFGEMNVKQESLGKVKEGQPVLIKLKGYPFEEYGMLHGHLSYLSDVPYKDSIFTSRVDLDSARGSDLKKPVHLKQGMLADAEIITQDATIFQRLTRNLVKALHSN
jgi:multidrug resistance efflux pump